MRIPTRKSEVDKRALAKEEDHYVSKDKLEQMQRDLTRLIKVERSPAAEEVARTAQMGDFSENAAYQYAKQNLRRINDRITTLEERIKHAVVIEKDIDGKIHIGSVVRLLTKDKEMTYEILGSLESNPFKGKISHSSPLGLALLGHRVGEKIEFVSGGKTTEYEIIEVK
jgi:transcription elongation factor GreA